VTGDMVAAWGACRGWEELQGWHLNRAAAGGHTGGTQGIQNGSKAGLLSFVQLVSASRWSWNQQWVHTVCQASNGASLK
jgi:hypothetical protein